VSATIRDRVLATLERFAPKAVDIPPLGTVYVRPLTVAGMSRLHRLGEPMRLAALARAAANASPGNAELEAKAKEAEAQAAAKSSPDDAGAVLISDCLVDEKGKRIFSDADLHLIGSMPGSVGERIMAEIQGFAPINDDEVKTAAGN
jgi:hypothetical protein